MSAEAPGNGKPPSSEAVVAAPPEAVPATAPDGAEPEGAQVEEAAPAQAGEGEDEEVAAAAESDQDVDEAAEKPTGPDQPVTLGFRTFASGKEANQYFHDLLTNLTPQQDLNEVRRAPRTPHVWLAGSYATGKEEDCPCMLSSHDMYRLLTGDCGTQYEFVVTMDLLRKGHPDAERKVGFDPT